MRKDFAIVLVVWLASVALLAVLTYWFPDSVFAPPSARRPGLIMFLVMFMLATIAWVGPLGLILMLFIPKRDTPAKPHSDESPEISN